MGTGDILLRGNLQWTTVVFCLGGSSSTPKHVSCYGNWYNLWPLGFWIVCIFACAQTSPISFVPRATKEIGDVCMQAMCIFTL